MPAPGYKTITVKEDVYEWFKREYEKRKVENRLEDGITSFSAWVSRMLYLMMEEEKK